MHVDICAEAGGGDGSLLACPSRLSPPLRRLPLPSCRCPSPSFCSARSPSLLLFVSPNSLSTSRLTQPDARRTPKSSVRAIRIHRETAAGIVPSARICLLFRLISCQDGPLRLRQDSSGSATGGPSAEGTATQAGSAATTQGSDTAAATGTDASSGTQTGSGSQGGTATNTDAPTNTATDTNTDTVTDTTGSATETQNTQNSPTSTQYAPPPSAFHVMLMTSQIFAYVYPAAADY